ncbi:MAG: hypothetical protein RSE27_04425, partial [Ruthenibacterium sp.]
MLSKLFGVVLMLTPWVSLILAILLMLRHFFGKKISARFFRLAWLVLALRLVLLVNVSLPQAPVQVPLPIQTITAPQNTQAQPPKTQVVMTLAAPQDGITAASPEKTASHTVDITWL